LLKLRSAFAGSFANDPNNLKYGGKFVSVNLKPLEDRIVIQALDA
jgi:hypothetical protein